MHDFGFACAQSVSLALGASAHMKRLALIVGALGLISAAYLYVVAESDRRGGIAHGSVELSRALKDLRETGALPDYGNPVQPFVFTNSVSIDGTNYYCAVGYVEPLLGGGFLAATTNGLLIYFDPKGRPKLVRHEPIL